MTRNGTARVFLLACLAVAVPRIGGAAVLVVTDFGDSGAPGQLRTLITLAAPGDTIVIPPGTIALAAPGGDLDINKTLTIVGSGADLTSIDAGGIDRAIEVFAVGNLVLSGVTLRNGAVHPDTGGGGGAIRNDGLLTMMLCAIENSSSGGGGGVMNIGTATIESTTFRGNTSSGITGAGGALMNFGTIAIGTSTFTQNATLGPTSSANGGAISNIGDMTMTNTTVSGNRAFGHGGGIFQGALATSLSLRNVTIADNEARLFGGGIEVMGFAPKIVNTILAANRAGTLGPDCGGTLNSDGYNLIQQTADCTIAGTATGNILGVNPHLLPLAANGGPAFTHALRRSSAAVDAGSAADCPASDQRGVPRPQDGNRDGIAACDIGAFELTSR